MERQGVFGERDAMLVGKRLHDTVHGPFFLVEPPGDGLTMSRNVNGGFAAFCDVCDGWGTIGDGAFGRSSAVEYS